MKYFSMLIKPASSMCNLRCKYCFYNDVAACREIPNYGMMKQQTMQACIDLPLNYFEEEVEITFLFQGGEPTCIGLNYFKDFIDYVKNKKKEYQHIHYGIQTNGTLLTEEWIAFIKENDFLVGVSLDGFKENHDSFRLDSNLQGSFQTVMETIHKLEEAKVEFNILTVLTSELAKKSEELFNFYLENELQYIQLIPCLPSFDKEDEYSLTPQLFASFYNEFFQLWKEELNNNNYISINFFDNIIPLFVGITPQQCGYLGFCNMQFVVESDGAIYPCDFYVLDQYQLGNVNTDTMVELSKNKLLRNFLIEEKRTCSLCKDCRYKNICYGQCKRMNVCYFDKEYCGYYSFLNKNETSILKIAKRLIK